MVADRKSKYIVGTISLNEQGVSDYFGIRGDGRWIIYRDKEDDINFYDMEQRFVEHRAMPFAIEMATFRVDDRTAYFLHSKKSVRISLSAFKNKGWYIYNDIKFLKNNWSNYLGQRVIVPGNTYSAYKNNLFELRDEMWKMIANRFFSGFKYQLRNDRRLQCEDDTLLNVPNEEGDLLTGIGPAVHFDTRGDICLPRKGFYLNGSFVTYENWIGGNYTYTYSSIFGGVGSSF